MFRSVYSTKTVLMASPAVASVAAYADENTAQEARTAASDTANLQEVVVTANVGGLKKLETGYSVTTLSEEQIKEANATSTADFLKASPGIYPEASGGNTGANVGG